MAHTHSYSVRLGDRGRLVLPAELRARLAAEVGDRFTVLLDDDGTVRLIAARAAARRGRGLLRDRVADGPSLVDELIADRREEARRE